MLLFFLCILFSGCEKWTCECVDDIKLIWKDDFVLEGVNVFPPNGVLYEGFPLAISVYAINSSVDWDLKFLKVYRNNDIFIDSNEPEMFVKKNYGFIEVPHEFITTSSDELISGPLSIELEILFLESNATLFIEGTITYYTCEDLDDDFGQEDCRWPRQVIGEHYSRSPC